MPAAKKPVAKKPVARKSTRKPAAAKKPAAKKAATAKKPTAKKPARGKPAAARVARAGDGAAALVAAAARIPAAEVKVCRIDIALARHNVETGLTSLRPHLTRLRKEVAGLPLDEILALPQLVTALLDASEQLERPASKAQNVKDLSRLRELREPMLRIAEGLAQLGHLPARPVADIRAGTGALDAARDGVALGRLFRKHAAAIAGKHPFADADFDEITALGEQLTQRITPMGARRAPKDPEGPAQRDRLFTLLVQRHAELRKAGYYLFGEDVDAHIPALQTRAARPRKKPDAPPSPAEPR